MRCHRTTLAGLALVLAIGAPATLRAASITTYSSKASFVAAIGPVYSQEQFDGFASGTAMTTQVAGLVLSSPNSDLAGALPVQAFASSGSVSAPNLLAGGYAPGTPNVAQVIVIDFLPDATAFGGYVSPLTPNSVTVGLRIDFRDQTSQTLTVSTGNNNHPEFLGLKSDTGIRRVTYTATKPNTGQQGFRNFGADDFVWVGADGNPPICTATKSIIAGVLGFDGTAADNAPFDTGVASVALVNATNVALACDAPLPAACGTTPSPVATATWRVEPSQPGVDGRGTVLATDASGNACAFDVVFTAFAGGAPDDLLVCQDTGVALFVSNPTQNDAGQIICSSTPPGPADPVYPPGYEPSPALDPYPCTVFTIKSPIKGETGMTLKKDGDFEPRLRMLFARFDGAVYPPFTDVTQSVDQVTTVIPDPTRLQGGGTWSQVKVACAVQAELCNGLDDDGDGQIDEGFPIAGPAIDCDGDGYPQCATTSSTATTCSGATVTLVPGAPADCNDQIAGINAGAVETCNGLDDNCDGQADDGSPEGGAACGIPGLLGACGAGVTDCATGPLVCRQVNFPADEICDGIDNDCDGAVDEGNPPGGAPCTLPELQGVCAAGAYSCATGVIECTQTVFPAGESCNGSDDDCDGATDEDLAPLSCGVGACATTVPGCVEGSPQACVPGAASPETCNGLDDDCDGATDEDLGRTSCGVGVCTTSVDNCVGGLPQTCTPGVASPETCNGLDDDCDDATDEELGQTSCGLGTCAATVDNCVAGVPQTCTPGTPSAEICNSLDDDCDGTRDEGYAFGGYLPPVRPDGSGLYQYSRTIPFKFRLTTCSGVAVTNAVASIEVIPYSSGLAGTVLTDVGNVKATAGNLYQYDAKGYQYMFNLGTKNLVQGRSYIVRTRISDGSVHDVVISLK